MQRLHRNLIVALTCAVFAGCAAPSGNQTPAIFSGAITTLTHTGDRVAPQASLYKYVKIPANDSIQDDLISTFPTGTFKAKGMKFKIPKNPSTCGYSQDGPCNFYDGFTPSEPSITINVSIPHVDQVYTLMNAYSPPSGQQIATIELVGSANADQTFDLVGGDDIRDFYKGEYANTLNNGIKGVVARNVFTCVDPSSCLGGGGTGDVHTGDSGTYNIDAQKYQLNSAFKNQTLVKIVITDTNSSSTPIVLGITAKST